MGNHCCEDLAARCQLTELGEDGAAGRPIAYDPVFDEYCLVGPVPLVACDLITHCPWCGTRLPPSQRERWYHDVRAAGFAIDDPDLPARFLRAGWWREHPDR